MSSTLLEIDGSLVCAEEMCEKHVPFDAALQFGRGVLAERIEYGFDLNVFTESVRDYTAEVTGYQFPAPLAHFYRKSGLEGDLAERTFVTVKNILALFAAWNEQRTGSFLSLPDRLDLVGWHGFILQTHEYAEFCRVMGHFVHHATTEGGQPTSSLLTMALYEYIFGNLDAPIWEDAPGSVIFGWCGDGE